MPEISIGRLVDLTAIAGVLFALWKGGQAERAAAVVVLLNIVIGNLGLWVAPTSEALIRLINDGIAALALLGITLRYAAPWMGGVMLFYAAQFSLHSFYLVMQRSPHDYLHALVNNIDFIGIVLCLTIGTVMAWRRRVRARKAKPAEA